MHDPYQTDFLGLHCITYTMTEFDTHSHSVSPNSMLLEMTLETKCSEDFNHSFTPTFTDQFKFSKLLGTVIDIVAVREWRKWYVEESLLSRIFNPLEKKNNKSKYII